MPTSIQTEPPARVTLAARITVNEVRTLCEELRQLARGTAAIELDGSEVTEIDTAALQLLATLWLPQSGPVRCEWRDVSKAFRHSATLVGLDRSLHLP